MQNDVGGCCNVFVKYALTAFEYYDVQAMIYNNY